jgi:hypothetical protein
LPEVIFCSAIQNSIPKKREQKKLLASSVRQAPSTEETIGETAIRQFPDLCVYYITRISKSQLPPFDFVFFEQNSKQNEGRIL